MPSKSQKLFCATDAEASQSSQTVGRIVCSAMPPSALGYGFWWAVLFSNGINGSSWMPLFQGNEPLAQTARIEVYALYAVLFGLALAFRKRLAPLNERRRLLVASCVLSSTGLVLMSIAGFCIVPLPVLWVGACLFGIGVMAPILGFSELYGLLGARGACINMCKALIFGAVLYLMIALLSLFVPLLAIAIEVSCPLLSLPMLFRAWRDLPKRQSHLETEKGPLKMPPALLAAMFVYGFSFGLILGLAEQTKSASFPVLVANALFISALALIVLAMGFTARAFSISHVYRPVLPLLAVGFLLLPVLGSGGSTVSVGVVLAGYACSRIFAATVYADITCRVPAPALGTAALGAVADTGGIVVSSLLAQVLLSAAGVEVRLVYDVSLVVVGVLIFVTVFLLAESGTSTLWGLLDASKDDPIPDSLVQARCAEAARAHGLTPREEEILAYLVRGKSAAEIAETLVVSAATVRTHAKHIHAKLGVHSRTELISVVCFLSDSDDARQS